MTTLLCFKLTRLCTDKTIWNDNFAEIISTLELKSKNKWLQMDIKRKQFYFKHLWWDMIYFWANIVNSPNRLRTDSGLLRHLTPKMYTGIPEQVISTPMPVSFGAAYRGTTSKKSTANRKVIGITILSCEKYEQFHSYLHFLNYEIIINVKYTCITFISIHLEKIWGIN